MSDTPKTPARRISAVLQIRLPCASAEDLRQRFGAELSQGGIFIRTKSPKAVGALVRFDFRYANGDSALRGIASVRHSAGEAEEPTRPGMQLGIEGLERESHELLRKIGLTLQVPVVRPSPTPQGPAPLGARPSQAPPVRPAPPAPVSPAPAEPVQSAQPPPAMPAEDPLAFIEARPERPLEPLPTQTLTSGELAPAPVPELPFDPTLEKKPIARTGPIVGIDLGTSNSCVAWLHQGRLQVIPSREGWNTVPSVVALSERGKLLVGHPAKSQLLTNPQNTIFGAKRLVGRSFHSQVVSELRERFPYEIVEGPRGEAAVRLGARDFTLQEISALVLREVREVAQSKLGQDVTRAVITVPAFYNELQRQAVREAGELAGIYVEQIVSEPTAAALALGHGRQLEKRVLVYDLGGGTFDVSVLELAGSVYEVISTGGDTFLGGVDFDLRLLGIMLARYEEAHGRPFDGERIALQRLLDAAERAKMALSESSSHRVMVPFVSMDGDRPLNLECVIERDEFEATTLPLIERTLQVTAEVLAARGLRPTDIDEVVLVGGQSRMPLVRSKLREYFGKEANKSVHPDEAVALGAAALAHALESESAGAVVLVDVLPMSIGVGLPGGRFRKVIERNTRLPHTVTHTIATTKDEQTELEIVVFQGESERAVENEHLGSVRIDGLPKAPRGAVKIDVTFRLSSESILTVTTREESSGRETRRELATRDTPEQLREKLADKAPEPEKKGLVGFFKRLFGRAA